MKRQNPKANKFSQVLEAIKDGITSGEFNEDPVLSEAILEEYLKKTRKLRISRMPIRRAIARLESEGIVDVLPQVGTVIRLPQLMAGLKETWESRVAIEEFALIELARKRHRNLAPAEEIQSQLLRLATSCDSTSPSSVTQVQADFLEQDRCFHESLARSAGHPRLADELNSLRFKLRIAAPLGELPKSRLIEICEEHENILAALRGDCSQIGIRPNINSVRLAFRVHMRNCARSSWKIEQRLKLGVTSEARSYIESHIFDVPDYFPVGPGHFESIGNLLLMRLNFELCAVAQLARPGGQKIDMAKALHHEMIDVSQRACNAANGAFKSQFINLDIAFHSAIAFSAGMLFAEEFISFLWLTLHAVGKYDLDCDRMSDVLNEHRRIIDTIIAAQDSDSGTSPACRAMQDHLLGSFLGNNLDKKTSSIAIDQIEALRDSLQRVTRTPNKLTVR